jgi:hypothetical protein
VQQHGHPVGGKRRAQLGGGLAQFLEKPGDGIGVRELLVLGEPAVAEPPADERFGLRVPQGPLDERLALLREELERLPARPGVALGAQGPGADLREPHRPPQIVDPWRKGNRTRRAASAG